MRLVTYQAGDGRAQAGVLRDGVIAPATGGPDMIALIAAGGRVEADESKAVPLAEVRLRAPIARPNKLICVGLNYRDHAEESKMEIPKVPTIFNKFTTSIIGPGEAIVLPKNSAQPDYEAEFAFVVGKGGRHIRGAGWRQHVFGYMCVNDVSARDFQMATTQWLMGKTFDTFAPCGPAIVTADEIADPHALDISLDINGEVLQSSNTGRLIFDIPALVEYVSSVCTLEPGDIVSTGTPAGVGFARKPPRWLKAGDVVTVKIAGVGELSNPVLAEA